MTIVINLDDAREGDVVAATVLDDMQNMLIAKDTLLTDYIIKRLRESNIKKIEVVSPCKAMGEKDFKLKQFAGYYNNNIVSVKKMIYNVAAGRKIEANNVNLMSDTMYKNFNSISYADIFKYMKGLRRKDEYTYFHSVNVAFYSMLMAKWLKLTEDETKKVIQAGFLHDVGKARVPLDILNKPGKLTDEEFEEIKKHPVYGYRILEESNFSNPDVKSAVLMHHERLNGTGYPFSAGSSEIGLTARIIAIADVYDAMTSDRVYKKRKTPFEAFKMFKTEGYAGFDVNITKRFINNLSISFVGARVRLSNGDEGKIVFVPPDNKLQPLIEEHGIVFPLYKDGLTIAEML